MHSRIILGLVAVAVSAGGCTSSGSSPATAPPTTERVTTSTTPTPSTTSTTSGTTTTTIDRTAEIQAIFEDLEQRRLTAIRDQDEAAFRSLYANRAYLEESMMAFESVTVAQPSAIVVLDFELITESEACIAALIERDYSGALPKGSTTERLVVLEPTGDGWGISWIGEGWSCKGSHPLDS